MGGSFCFCFANLAVESCEPADAKRIVPETPLELDVAEPLLRPPEVVESPPVESLTPLQQQVLSSSQVATLLGDPRMQAKIGGILEAQDPERALREAIQNDPDGVGRIACIIYGFIDQSSQ